MELVPISATRYEQHYGSDQELAQSVRRTREWTIPRFESLGIHAPASVLSIGCGSGMDVVVLREAGYQARGVDLITPLPDAAAWVDKADVRRLPYDAQTFDGALMLGVIEHIGLDHGAAQDVDADRRQMGREITRVLKIGGVLVLSTPNRRFPIDEHGSPARIHSPFRDYTFTLPELRRLFPDCSLAPLPYGQYFAHKRARKLIGPLHHLLPTYLDLCSNRLQATPLNPYLLLAVRRER